MLTRAHTVGLGFLPLEAGVGVCLLDVCPDLDLGLGADDVIANIHNRLCFLVL